MNKNIKLIEEKVKQSFEEYEIDYKLGLEQTYKSVVFKLNQANNGLVYNPDEIEKVSEDEAFKKMSIELGVYIWNRAVEQNDYMKLKKTYKDNKLQFANDLFEVMNGNLFIQSINDLLEDIGDNKELLKKTEPKKTKSKAQIK